MANAARTKWPEHETFIETWQKAGSASEVAKAFKSNLQSVSNQAHYLRRHGVPLQKFASPGRPRLDVDTLAKLARSAKRG